MLQSVLCGPLFIKLVGVTLKNAQKSKLSAIVLY